MFDPTKPVRTRDGRKARIICRDAKSSFTSINYPIVALIISEFDKKGEELYCYTSKGHISSDDKEHRQDLINIEEEFPEEKEKTMKEDKSKKIDWEKPLQTIPDKYKCEVLCKDFKIKTYTENFYLIRVYKDEDESITFLVMENGVPFFKGLPYKNRWDIENIPEPESLKVHVGGVYKTRSGGLAIIQTIERINEKDVYPYSYFDQKDNQRWVTEKGMDNIDEKESEHDLIEYLGDIRDLNPKIAELLK